MLAFNHVILCRRRTGLHCHRMWQKEERYQDRLGKVWHFRYWSESWKEPKGFAYASRLFFWDDDKECCGVVIFPPATPKRLNRARFLTAKLVADPNLRKHHQRDLRFPLERYYSDYGSFPEENQIADV